MEISEEEGELAHKFRDKTFSELQNFTNKTLCQRKPLVTGCYSECNQAQLLKPDATCSIRLYFSYLINIILVFGYPCENTNQQNERQNFSRLKLTFKNTNLAFQFTTQICLFEREKHLQFVKMFHFSIFTLSKYFSNLTNLNMRCNLNMYWIRGEAYSYADATSMFTCGRRPPLTQYSEHVPLSQKRNKRQNFTKLKSYFKNTNITFQPFFVKTFIFLNFSERAPSSKPEGMRSIRFHHVIYYYTIGLEYFTSHNTLTHETLTTNKRESKRQAHYTMLNFSKIKPKFETMKLEKLKVRREVCYGTPVKGGSRHTHKPNRGKKNKMFYIFFKLLSSTQFKRANKSTKKQCKGLGRCQIGPKQASIRYIRAKHNKGQNNKGFLESMYISMQKQTHKKTSYTNFPTIASGSAHTHEAQQHLKDKGKVNSHNHHTPHHTSNPPKKTKWG